jgi:prepilin-type processing-associated H-X9-DG protein
MGRLSSRTSFSLLELAVIIGIMAILLAIIYPGIDMIIERSQRAKAARNLRTIALAHANFINDFGRAIQYKDVCIMKGSTPTSCDVNLFAAVLAKYGYTKDVSIWAWDFDYLVKQYKQGNTLPTKIYNTSNDRIASEFAGKQSGGNFPLSVLCCVVQSPDFDYTQLLSPKFPAAISRGLGGNGIWRKKSGNLGGIWGNKGGLIAFFDGHVEWYEDIKTIFKKYGTSDEASAICATLPNFHNASNGNYTDSCFLSWERNGDYGGVHN